MRALLKASANAPFFLYVLLLTLPMALGYTFVLREVTKQTVGVVAQSGLECLPVTQEVAGSNPVNPVPVASWVGVRGFILIRRGRFGDLFQAPFQGVLLGGTLRNGSLCSLRIPC